MSFNHETIIALTQEVERLRAENDAWRAAATDAVVVLKRALDWSLRAQREPTAEARDARRAAVGRVVDVLSRLIAKGA